ASRSGKTNTVKNNIRGIMHRKRKRSGLEFIDFHGDATDVRGNCPRWNLKRLTYWEPASPHALAFNVFANARDRAKRARAIVDFWEKQYAGNFGARMSYVLVHGCFLLCAEQNDLGITHCFRDLERLFKDEVYRRQIVNRTQRESERVFWNT